MKKLIIVSICLFSLCDVGFPNYTIKIKVKGLPLYPVLLTDFYGDKNAVIDTVQTDFNGVALFSVPDNQHAGMYKFVFKDDKFIDFIFNKENVEMETDMNNVQGNIHVIESKENKLYFDYLKALSMQRSKFDALQQLVDKYPAQDPFVKQVYYEYNDEKNSFKQFEDSLERANAATYAARVIRLKSEVLPDISLSSFERVQFKKTHWFDNTDFNDTLLIYSNGLTTKIIEYLTIYASKYFSPEQQTQVFRSAIDSILSKSRVNKKMYDFTVDFLFNGFEQMGNDKLVEYVASKYTNENSCEHDGSKTTLERKVLTYTKLKIGTDAPAFDAISDKGTKVSLNTYADKTILLVFWATWCPHCMQTMPELKKLYNSRIDNNFEMVTVSLDTSKTEWKDYVTRNGFTSNTNICDGKSWDGAMASAYYVYSSPTILVIKNKKIIARPNDMETLMTVLKENNIIK